MTQLCCLLAHVLPCAWAQVSEALFDVLTQSRHHPSLDQMWRRHHEALLAYPNHEFSQSGGNCQ